MNKLRHTKIILPKFSMYFEMAGLPKHLSGFAVLMLGKCQNQLYPVQTCVSCFAYQGLNYS